VSGCAFANRDTGTAQYSAHSSSLQSLRSSSSVYNFTKIDAESLFA